MNELINAPDIVDVHSREELIEYVGSGKILNYNGFYIPPGCVDKDGNVRRTRELAEMNGEPLAKLPDKRYRLTHPDFRYALTPLENADIDEDAIQKAYVQLMLVGIDEMTMDKQTGSLLMNGKAAEYAKLIVDEDQAHVANLDMPLVNSLFSIIWYNIRQELDDLVPDRTGQEWDKVFKRNSDIQATVNGYYIKLFGFGQRVFIPDFLKMIGLDYRSVNEAQVDALMDRIAQFTKLRGTIVTPFGKKLYPQPYLFLAFHHDKPTNCFYIQSQYMNMVIERAIRDKHYAYMKRGRVQSDNHGNVLYIPPVTTIVHPYLDNLPSKRAAQLADAIATLIETCPNDGIPHIIARSLIRRCTMLNYVYETTDDWNKRNVFVRRTFKKAYEYLKDYTYVYDKYRNLKMPSIPSIKEIESDSVLEFRFDGLFKESVAKKKMEAKTVLIESKLTKGNKNR